MILKRKHKNHKNKNLVIDAWNRLVHSTGIPLAELKKKGNPDDSFYDEFSEEKASMKSGVGEEDTHKQIWIFHDTLEVLLKEIHEYKSIFNTEDEGSTYTEENKVDTDLYTVKTLCN